MSSFPRRNQQHLYYSLDQIKLYRFTSCFLNCANRFATLEALAAVTFRKCSCFCQMYWRPRNSPTLHCFSGLLWKMPFQLRIMWEGKFDTDLNKQIILRCIVSVCVLLLYSAIYLSNWFCLIRRTIFVVYLGTLNYLSAHVRQFNDTVSVSVSPVTKKQQKT